MVALDFPDAPSNGQVFDKWTWDGTQWVLTAGVATPWTDLTSPGLLISGWVPFSATVGGGWPGFRKVGDRCELRGLVKNGVNGVICTLPASFKPPGDQYFAAITSGSIAELNITSNADVIVNRSVAAYLALTASWSTTR